jgi:multimeric flavodoxin WrbA
MDRRDFIEKSAMAAGGVLLAATGAEALTNNKNGKTMKVLMINGSPHQKGNTAIALDEIAKQLKVNGIESEIVWIGNKAVRGCIACGGCSRNPGKCVFDDDICNRISEKFAEADALVVGSPVYYGQPNGAVLSVLQRAFFSNGAQIAGKPAAAVAVCRRGGASAVFDTLNMPFQMMNMPLVTSQYWNIVYGREAGQAALDQEGRQTMRALGRNMAWLLKATGGQPAPGRGDEPWAPMHFIR